MKFERPYSLGELAELLSCEFSGDENLQAEGINEIHMVQEGDVVFVDHPKYYQDTIQSGASVIIIDKEVEVPAGKGLLIDPKPFEVFNRLAFELSSKEVLPAEIGETSMIHQTASIANNVIIGEGCLIHPGVVVNENCVIGNHVVIQPNSVVGSDAFYYKTDSGTHTRMNSVGRVVTEDDVEIGAGCTIDRGVTSDTLIGSGTKMDNQIHVGHDVQVGKNCRLAAQVGLAGCVVLEDDVTLWGQVGVATNVSVGRGAVVYAQSGVAKSVPAGQTYFGSPAIQARKMMQQIALITRLSSEK